MIIKNPTYIIPPIGVSGDTTVLASAWANDVCTITISGFASGNSIILTPSSSTDEAAIRENGIYVTPQSQNGEIVFTADTTPEDDISFDYLIVKCAGASKVFMCGIYGAPSTPPAPANQVRDQNGNPVTDENGNPVTAD